MARLQGARVVLTLMLVVALAVNVGVAAGKSNGRLKPRLVPGFYLDSCPNAEQIIYAEMKRIFNMPDPQDLLDVGPNVAPDLLRLHFHDCFVQGCDGSVLLDGPDTEKTAGPNARLEGFDFVDQIKAKLEEACPGVVSCSDLLAFAARDGVRLTGGMYYWVPAGRRDGFTSVAAKAVANLPDPRMSVDQLTANFANQRLTRDDMVVLSGAHTIGDVACHHIDNRLYTYPVSKKDKSGVDPSLPKAFVAKLKSICPLPGLLLTTVDMDQPSPITFDSQYYKNLVTKESVLSSDQILYTDKRTRPLVEKLTNKGTFLKKFAEAMVKMGNIPGLVAPEGEVRINCRKVNAPIP